MERSLSDTYTTFVEEVASRVRTALIAAYGPEVGAEATAEALVYAWEHWERIGPMENPAGYLYRVGRSRAVGILRRSQYPPVRAVPSSNSDHWVEPGLPKALAKLSERQRLSLVLVDGLGWTLAEVGEFLGVTPSTVQRHRDRGLGKLRRSLGVESDT